MGYITDDQEQWNRRHKASEDMTDKEKVMFDNEQRIMLLLAVIADNLNAMIQDNGY